MSYQFYCLSFKNEIRRINMCRRFNQVNIDCIFYEGVSFEDDRIKKHVGLSDHTKRTFSCAYGHLDMITKFYYETDKDYGIFCEDDIYIHKELAIDLPSIISDNKFDILLLSYLLPFTVRSEYIGFELKAGSPKTGKYKYHNYPDDTWGAQMYMMTREHAKYVIDTYSHDYADRTLIQLPINQLKCNLPVEDCSVSNVQRCKLTPFSSDWLFTKDGNRALIAPILATEDNQSFYTDLGQREFHKKCFLAHFDDATFIV